jgi:carbon storage regulator
MFVLTRRLGEKLIIGDNIKITVEKINKSQIKRGNEAPNDVAILTCPRCLFHLQS